MLPHGVPGGRARILPSAIRSRSSEAPGCTTAMPPLERCCGLESPRPLGNRLGTKYPARTRQPSAGQGLAHLQQGYGKGSAGGEQGELSPPALPVLSPWSPSAYLYLAGDWGVAGGWLPIAHHIVSRLRRGTESEPFINRLAIAAKGVHQRRRSRWKALRQRRCTRSSTRVTPQVRNEPVCWLRGHREKTKRIEHRTSNLERPGEATQKP